MISYSSCLAAHWNISVPGSWFVQKSNKITKDAFQHLGHRRPRRTDIDEYPRTIAICVPLTQEIPAILPRLPQASRRDRLPNSRVDLLA